MTAAMRPRTLLALVVALSVGLRIGAALMMGDTAAPQPGTWDQVSYDQLARRVAGGFGFSFAELSWPYARPGAPTAFWSLLYTSFVALHYQIFGPHPLAPRLVQAVLAGILLPLGTYRLGARTLGPRAGLWAAGLSAAYIYFVYYGAALMTEAFTVVAVVWLLAQLVDLADRPTRRGWVALGVWIGVAALLRQVTLATVPVLALWLVWRRRDRRSLAGLALAAGVALLLILPVTVRNYRAFGRLVPINTNAGFAFFWANHPVHGTDFQGVLPDGGPSYQDLIPADLRGLDEAALDGALLARGWEFVWRDPARYALLSLSRLEDYFKFWPSADSSRLSNLSRVGSFGILLPFMLAGLFLSRAHWRACLPLYLFAGAYAMVHLLSWSLIRYRLPVDAVLLVFAGLACDRAWAALRLPGTIQLAPSPLSSREGVVGSTRG